MEEELPETFSEKYPKLTKILIFSIATFLLIITLIYFLTTPQIRSILSGLIESETIEDFKVQLKTGNYLVFTKETYQELLQIYNNNPEKEFKVCLNGYIEEDYLITEVFIPKTYLQTHSSVSAEPCPNDSLVSMHSHPLKHCLPSDVDLKNFNIFKQNNQKALMAVMCEKDRFNFYS